MANWNFVKLNLEDKRQYARQLINDLYDYWLMETKPEEIRTKEDLIRLVESGTYEEEFKRWYEWGGV